MNKKNILLSVALIVVAILAGCSNQSMYPKFPVSALIRQTGDVVEGQVFDASKFEVVVNYLDNTTQTISGAGIQWTDGDDKVGGMSADDTLEVNVGNDYYGKPVTNKISPSVYTVDHITAEAKSGVEFTVGTTAKSTDFVVSAYYTADKFIVLNAADYKVEATEADTKAEGYDAEAEEVPAFVTITFGEYEYTLNVTAANPQTPAPVMVGLLSVAPAGDIYAYDYETLPEITAADVKVKAKASADDSEGFELTAAQLADAEFSFVNATTQLPLLADEYDFTNSAANVAIKVVLGDYEVVSSKLTLTTPEVTVKYTGKALEQGADLAAVPADYYVTVKEGKNYRQLTDLTADDFIFSSENTLGEFVEGTGYEHEVKDGKVPATLYVFVDYQGVQNKTGAAVTTYAKGEAKVQSITATTVEGLVGPAKQYYTTIANVKPSTTVADVIASVTITTDQGSKTITAADTEEWKKVTIATAYSLSNTADEALAESDDIMNASKLYLKVTYNSATSCYVEIPFSTAVATGVTLSADYGKVAYYDAPVDWTIKLTNSNGVVNDDYTGAYTAYAVEDSSSKKADLPAKLGEAGSYKVAVVLEDGTLVESTAVSLTEGTAWYELGNDFKVTYTGEKIYIDDKLSGVTKDKFTVSGATYHGADEATQPEVTAVTVVEGEPVEASNTVYVTVTYKGKDLQDHTKTEPVTIPGTPYGEASTATLAWAKDNSDVTTLPEGTYNVSDFVVKGYKAHGDAPIVITVKPQNGSAITSGTFQAKNYESVTFSYSYLDKDGEMTEVKELKTITVTAAVEEA